MFFFLGHHNVEWSSILSEPENSRSLSEKITDVARNERNGLLVFQMGVVLVCAGVIVSVLGCNSMACVGGVFFIVLGTVSTVFGFYVSIHYAHQYNNLLKELDAIG